MFARTGPYLITICALWMITGCSATAGSEDPDMEPPLLCEHPEFEDLGIDGMTRCICKEGFTRIGERCVQKLAPPEDMGPSEPPAPELPRAIPLTCWLPPGSYCDPRDGSGCNTESGETCDVTKDEEDRFIIACVPGPNPQALGEPCNATAGPYCSHGLRCSCPGVCKKVCCEDNECPTGLACQPSSNAGSLGVCDMPATNPQDPPNPMCQSTGTFCQAPTDCCSNQCVGERCLASPGGPGDPPTPMCGGANAFCQFPSECCSNQCRSNLCL